MYCHIGIGKPYVRSCEFFLSDIVTSTAAKKRFSNNVRVEGSLGYPFKFTVSKFDNAIIHRYRYSHRQYFVFPKNFYDLFLALYNLVLLLYKYFKKDVDSVFKYVTTALSRCCDANECIKVLAREKDFIEGKIFRKILKGRRALATRFKKNAQRCKHLILRYFPEFNHIYVFRYSSLNELRSFLERLFNERIARAYQQFNELNNPILVAKEGLILITKDNLYPKDFSIYVDDCVNNNSYVLFKLVGALTADDYVYKIKWLALLGIDLHTNQIFLHYLPPTLILHKVEQCRLWLLHLVDDFGRPIEDNYVLIET